MNFLIWNIGNIVSKTHLEKYVKDFNLKFIAILATMPFFNKADEIKQELKFDYFYSNG